MSQLSHIPNTAELLLVESYIDPVTATQHQTLLTQTDELVLQFPLYWYGCPAIMQHWIEQVLTQDFAYGKHFKINHLRVKLAITTGAKQRTYQTTGRNHHTVLAYLTPLLNTFTFCNVNISTQDIWIRYNAHQYQHTKPDETVTQQYLAFINS